jgi:hypothetical protein
MTGHSLTPFDGPLTVTLAPDVRLINAFRRMLDDNGWTLVQHPDGRNTIGGLHAMSDQMGIGEPTKHRFSVVPDQDQDQDQQE